MRRVLFVGRTRYRLPLDESVRKKFDALGEVLDFRVLGSGVDGSPRGDERFRLAGPYRPRALDGVAFFATLPSRIARELRDFRPDAMIVQGAHEAAAALLGRKLARMRTPLILDVHGDWRTATRLYGSPARKLLNPLADRLALAAIRRADATRTVSAYTTSLAQAHDVEPAAVFPAFMDLDPFLRPVVPLPPAPRALFVGVLEHYKGIDELARAWRLAALQVPDAHLHVVGRGSRREVVEALVRELPERVTWSEQLSTPEVADALDASTCLVLSSRSEGMGRVLVEALCRGRPVVATRVGGIVDLITDGENGVLVPPQDPQALADGLVAVLGDRQTAETLAAAARPSVEPWLATPQEYAGRVRDLVEACVH